MTQDSSTPGACVTTRARRGPTGAIHRDADSERRYAAAALDRESRAVEQAQGGSRNARLNAAAFALGRLIAPDRLSRAEVDQRLLEAARATGLPVTETRTTIRSGVEAGLKNPRPPLSLGAGPTSSSNRTLLAAATVSTLALDIWRRARPVEGTIAETYMRRRGIAGSLPLALRFHDSVPMPDEGRHPCLVAAVSVPTTGEIIAIQRTALRLDGNGKAGIEPARASLGSTRGGAVVLGTIEGGQQSIVEGEGVETVVAVIEALGGSGIATLSQSTLGRVPLPPGRDVILVVDRGAEAAARKAAGRRHGEGRRVRIALIPDDVRPGVHGVDANDVLQDRGVEGVRAMVDRAELYNPGSAPAELPEGYRRRSDGWIEFCRDDADGGDGDWTVLCSPLEVLAATRDDEGRAWGRLVRVQDADGQWNEAAVPMTWFAGDGRELRAALFHLGLELIGPRAPLTHLIAARPASRALCVPRLGWHERTYVMPDAVIGSDPAERIVWQPSAPTSHAFRVAGSLDGWRTAVAAPAAGNSRLVLAIALAFATPLLAQLGIEGGGFHVRGTSSTGKTTMLHAAGSVWGGGGIGGFIRRWRATANGLEGVALAHCDALLCLDEIADCDASEVDRAAYMLANGQGKQRAGLAGEARVPATWRVLVLSTGELSLADKLAEGGRRAMAGQEVRFVDIAADAGAGLGLFDRVPDGTPEAFADQIAHAARIHYGHPARAFLEALTRDLDTALGCVRHIMQGLERDAAPPSASGQVMRVLARFALVAAAGELAVQFGVVPWQQGEATVGVMRCWDDWLAVRGGVGDRDEQRAIAQVRAFIEAHGDSRFASRDASMTVPHRCGFRTAGSDGQPRWLVLPEAWRIEVCRGFDHTFVARALERRGMLETDPGSYQVRRRIPGLGQIRTYALTHRLFDSSDA